MGFGYSFLGAFALFVIALSDNEGVQMNAILANANSSDILMQNDEVSKANETTTADRPISEKQERTVHLSDQVAETKANGTVKTARSVKEESVSSSEETVSSASPKSTRSIKEESSSSEETAPGAKNATDPSAQEKIVRSKRRVRQDGSSSEETTQLAIKGHDSSSSEENVTSSLAQNATEESAQEIIQRLKRRIQREDSSSEEQSQSAGRGQESSSSSEEKPEEVPPAEPTIITEEQRRSIWDELKNNLNWTEEHIDKYRNFMDKLRTRRAEKLREMGIAVEEHYDMPVSPEYNPELFEGDILLTESQIDALETLFDESNSTLTNEELGIIASNLQSRWTTTIRYMIEGGVNAGAIEAGIRKWMELTCLNFIRDHNYRGDKMSFYNGGGCFSSVGKIPGVQKVSLGPGCESLGTVCHEIAHALGVWHEHTRHDRDQFIHVDMGNIISGARGNFERLTTNFMFHQEIPYDYGSTLHYASKSFAVNRNRYALTAKKSAFQTTMGQRNGPSFLDAKLINLAYCRRCSGSCENAGYVNPKTCQGCICPEGFAGSRCEHAARTGTNCGTIDVDVRSGRKTISKSGTGICYWVVKANPGRRIRATFNNFNMHCEDEVCNQAYVGMSLEYNIGQAMARICCRPSGPLVSFTHVVVMKYYSNRNAALTVTVEQV